MLAACYRLKIDYLYCTPLILIIRSSFAIFFSFSMKPAGSLGLYFIWTLSFFKGPLKVTYIYGPFPHYRNPSSPLLIFVAALSSSLECFRFSVCFSGGPPKIPMADTIVIPKDPRVLLRRSTKDPNGRSMGVATLVAAKTNPKRLPWRRCLLLQSRGALVVHWEVRTNPNLPLRRSMRLWM
jgi:hypothetical protein